MAVFGADVCCVCVAGDGGGDARDRENSGGQDLGEQHGKGARRFQLENASA
jgi:hypothetical protein